MGGWSLVRDVLAEDYAIGQAFSQAGLQVIHAPEVLFTYNRHWPLARFVNRHLRWGQMRRRVCLGAYLCEPLFNPGALFVLAALSPAAARRRAGLVPAGCGLGIALKFRADRLLWRRMRGEDAPAAGHAAGAAQGPAGAGPVGGGRGSPDHRLAGQRPAGGSRLARCSARPAFGRRRDRPAEAVDRLEAV